ncbi:MAG: biotin/lipoyl-containing protein, partial [Catalinimonas sp.]
MSLEAVKVPTVGESITEVTIGAWQKEDGDYVEVDEVLCELESDKATFDVPATAAGTLRIKAQEGDVLAIDDLICEIDTAGEGGGSAAPAEEATEAAPAAEASSDTADVPTDGGAAIEMRVPGVGESITEVIVGAWQKEDGDTVALDEVLCELESDKATFDLPAEAEGTLRIKAQEGDTLEIGALICVIETSGNGSSGGSQAAAAPASAEAAPAPAEKASHADGLPSPVAAKILEEKGIDAKSVKGTGPGGRITKEDALNAGKAPPSNGQATKTPPPPPKAPATP